MIDWVTNDDITLSSASRSSQSVEAILSLFLLDTEESGFFVSSAKEDWSIISHQQCFILMFSSLSLYFLLNVCRRLSVWVSCVLLLFISHVSGPFCFLQFASVTLCLISRMCLIGGWSTVFVTWILWVEILLFDACNTVMTWSCLYFKTTQKSNCSKRKKSKAIMVDLSRTVWKFK